jgi:hypothetical protein
VAASGQLGDNGRHQVRIRFGFIENTKLLVNQAGNSGLCDQLKLKPIGCIPSHLFESAAWLSRDSDQTHVI